MKLALATSLIAYASAFSTSSFGVSRNSMQLNALFGDNLEAELEREVRITIHFFSYAVGLFLIII